MGNYNSKKEEELKKLLKRKEKEIEKLQKTRLGLYWDKEREPEQVVLDCENNLPVLKKIKGKEIKNDEGEENILIEGDNFHALTCLNYTHKGKIDVIYIDPPYNTGAKDWKYNNKFVDSNDGYRHSKWLNMMEKRLRLARNLLSEKGFIIIAIDHYELLNLGLLCDETFGEENRCGVITVVHKPEGRQFSKGVNPTNEFMLWYSKNKQEAMLSNYPIDEGKLNEFDCEDDKGKFCWINYIRLGGGDSNLRINKPGNWYPIYVSKDFSKIDILPRKDWLEVFPITASKVERTWNTSKKGFLENIQKGNVKVEYKNNQINIFRKKRAFQIIKTHWVKPSYNATRYGTQYLEKIIGKGKFDYPKSLYAVLDALKITSQKNSIILDFFAGSGTTGHAVLELNKEDGGNRKFILCTNNEINGYEQEFREKYNLSNKEFEKERKEKSKRYLKWEEKYGICSTVTYPRIEKVINGYDFQGKDSTELYHKEIKSYTQLKQIDIDEIEEIKEANKDKFDKVSINLKDGVLKVIGEKNIIDKKAGLGGNLHYFKTDLVSIENRAKKKDKEKLRLNDRERKELTSKAGQMIAIKENIFEELVLNNFYQIFESKDKKRRVGIYFREGKERFVELVKELEGEYKSAIYIFSYRKINKKSFSFKKSIRLEDIPEPILEIYKEVNRLIKR